MPLTRINQDLRDFTFTFLDLGSMARCSRMNRLWKHLALGSGLRVFTHRYQVVINQIYDKLQVSKYLQQATRVKFLNFMPFQSICSFSVLSIRSVQIHHLIRHVLFYPINPEHTLDVVLRSDRLIEEYILNGGSHFTEGVDKTVCYESFLENLANIFRNLLDQGMLEEALIVAKLMPIVDEGDKTYLNPYHTTKSACLQTLCLSFLKREEIKKVLQIADEIPIPIRKNQVYHDVIKLLIRKDEMHRAYLIIHSIQNSEEQYFISHEELAKAYLDRGQKDRAIQIKDLIPDNDLNGCKKRLEELFNS